jgi:hypothetical protein
MGVMTNGAVVVPVMAKDAKGRGTLFITRGLIQVSANIVCKRTLHLGICIWFLSFQESTVRWLIQLRHV